MMGERAQDADDSVFVGTDGIPGADGSDLHPRLAVMAGDADLPAGFLGADADSEFGSHGGDTAMGSTGSQGG